MYFLSRIQNQFSLEMAGSWRNRSDRASSVSGVDNPLLPSVDLRNANQQLLSHQQVDQKCFNVKLKGTTVLHTMIFKRETKDSTFSNLCSKFELEESNATVQYPVREEDGSTGVVTIINDQFLQVPSKSFMPVARNGAL